MRVSDAARLCCALVGVCFFFAPAAHAALLGVHWDTGALYEVSTTDASLTVIGNTGVSRLSALEFDSNGTLYAITATSDTASASLYTIDPATAQATMVGPMNQTIFEGALAFGPSGTAYATNKGSVASAQLLQVNLTTGNATVIGTLTGSPHDINGLAWRSDNMLVGLDGGSGALVAIDPATAASSLIASLPITLGSVGGMAAVGDTAYIASAGPGASVPGSNRLYSVDLFTGQVQLIGDFPVWLTGTGIAGLAVPEPATLVLMGLAGLALRRRRSGAC